MDDSQKQRCAPAHQAFAFSLGQCAACLQHSTSASPPWGGWGGHQSNPGMRRIAKRHKGLQTADIKLL